MSDPARSGSIPWIEKYRPDSFDDIVLGSVNRRFFQNILKNNSFPNLLLYGPPGTGKTTTILNLIDAHQVLYSRRNKNTVIHLNASNDRGIDVVRTQINQFVNSMGLFEAGVKFVVLDEADYMTKTAQQALKHILQSNAKNIRVCLMCNYISKIDESLKNEFVCVRFNHLPREDIFRFVQRVAVAESIDIEDAAIVSIQETYGSDIRGMINFLQLNQGLERHEWSARTMRFDALEAVHAIFLANEPKAAVERICHMSVVYNTDTPTILKRYIDHVIRHHPHLVVPQFLDIMQIAVHNRDGGCEMDTLEFFSVFSGKFLNDHAVGALHKIESI